ncbi:HNH endonuclease [Streptomyces sp. MBT49]|uniref:HNH endonuclease signature motif containing protein n=1 Tax=Streptomyces sp. MBT49 TaxID=1488380 RepID=UPI00190C4F13|nr:HNH endonuclease signature motif containing protein [Streptomyces sp. MBT49]MBK3627000.1 HNH endonuclease [Streptomyces sp. MBT49]
MAISSSARKVLWARSGGICAFTECLQELTVDLRDEESATLSAAGVPLGEEAHIISGAKGGPRYESTYPEERVDSYENLILLCPTHHRLVDKNRGLGFTVDALRRMKVLHETEQRAGKTHAERRREETEIRVSAVIEVWATKAGLDDWDSFTGKLNAPIPRLNASEIDALVMESEWLTTRKWPLGFPEMHRSFANYARNLSDMVSHIRRTMDRLDGREDIYEVYREHKHRRMSEEEYSHSSQQFQFNTDVLYELSYELTKAANFVCDAIRRELDPLFRLEQGVLPLRVGDGFFGNKVLAEEYDAEELGRDFPYVGLTAIIERVKTQGGASR